MDPALSNVLMIVLTGRDSAGNEGRSLDLGAGAFFQKPVDEAELLRVIRANLPATLGLGPLAIGEGRKK
jgi:DNA-binding response OmpR family regulator